MMKLSLIALTLVMMLAAPQVAHAAMPQTDVDMLAQLDAQTAPQKLKALEQYYALHVSELDVQMKIEVRTGAFFAHGRSKGGPDVKAQAKRTLDAAAAEVDVAKAQNVKLRHDLSDLTGIDFDDSLVMAPDAPDGLPPLASGVADDLVKARAQAWADVVSARATWKDARLNLLDVQDRYNQGEKVSVGDAMRAITKAEISMAQTAGAYRLVEANIAVSLGQPIQGALNAL